VLHSQENKCSGNPTSVGKKANKVYRIPSLHCPCCPGFLMVTSRQDKLIELYNKCFDDGLFQSEDERAAEKLAQDLARQAKLDEEKKAKVGPAAD